MELLLFPTQLLFVLGSIPLSNWANENFDRIAHKNAMKQQGAASVSTPEVESGGSGSTSLDSIASKRKLRRRKKMLKDGEERNSSSMSMEEDKLKLQAPSEESEFTTKETILVVLAVYLCGILLLFNLLLMSLPHSHYRLLGIPYASSPFIVKRAYQFFHKRAGYSKEEKDLALKAYKTLSNRETKEIYDRLGAEAIESGNIISEEYLLSLVKFFVTWILVSFIISDTSKARKNVFGWSVFALFVVVSYEGATKYLNWFNPCYSLLGIPILDELTIYEAVEGIKQVLYPLFLSSAVFYSNYTYSDRLPEFNLLLGLVEASQQDVHESLESLLAALKERREYNANKLGQKIQVAKTDEEDVKETGKHTQTKKSKVLVPTQ